MESRDLSSKRWWREHARVIRDEQWNLMERMQQHGTLWICPWNKARRPAAEDEYRAGILDWLPVGLWFDEHADWFTVGAWSFSRDAVPYQLTEAGIAALGERYDMEPVRGGLVEPGWQAIPLERESNGDPTPV